MSLTGRLNGYDLREIGKLLAEIDDGAQQFIVDEALDANEFTEWLFNEWYPRACLKPVSAPLSSEDARANDADLANDGKRDDQ